MELNGRRIGVLGCSSRMRYVLELLLKINPNHKIIAIHDINDKAVETYKEKFGLDVRIYEKSKDLVKDSNVEWIFVGSSNYLHKKYIIDAFNEEKNVFSEKTIAISVQECQ